MKHALRLLFKLGVMCCTLQCGGHRQMSLASVPLPVFVGQSIAHNDSGVVVVQAASPN